MYVKGIYMFRKLAIAALLPLGLIQAATAAELPGKGLVEKGALTYGTAATFAPFEFQKDGKLTGFDIDFIQALGEKLHATPKPLNMEFKGLIPALLGGRTDIINSAMYINPQRSEQVDFVPYMKIGNVVIVQKGNPAKITGRDDSLCGKNIAVTLGGIEESQARADVERCKAKGLKPLTVSTLPTAQDSALNLRQGRADAIFESSPGAAKLLQEVPDTFQTVGEEFEANTQIGFATRKGETALQDSLKAAIKEVVADGTYDKLLAKWNLPASGSIFK
ncbi:amino acid ABC transporter substrate-binding protein, PAAT family [Faunimonas pinastri]|uniref:Amino acid ABC transporter substrate-binding protein, PAAT family n=1 Tax=Faunimonas pinastri TaxID=1855383 RepID=A0A1H9ESK8_9HYPH|nr:ABC transporter substrate-binding protein [Faunimonas pinastri]SEQ27988.1 amino acid ABC transporter substrate-binding protein, PAAT family [Faunimonas pinastri]